MKKKVILRGMLGAPLGMALGYLITIILSVISAEGGYSPCNPELTAAMGSEINAVLLQAFLSALLGMGFGASSAIWEMEDWSLVKQTGLYFLIISVIMLPIAYVSYWMEHTLRGILGYFGIFLCVFAAVWIGQYAAAKRNVKKMNESLREMQGERK